MPVTVGASAAADVSPHQPLAVEDLACKRAILRKALSEPSPEGAFLFVQAEKEAPSITPEPRSPGGREGASLRSQALPGSERYLAQQSNEGEQGEVEEAERRR